MSDREKLIELLCNVIETDGCSGHCDFPPCYLVKACADHLISNGVTVQKWIPVSERLPEEKTLVLCIWSRTSEEAFYGFARYQGGDNWYVSNEGMPTVTHWMPLPEPPKECE